MEGIVNVLFIVMQIARSEIPNIRDVSREAR